MFESAPQSFQNACTKPLAKVDDLSEEDIAEMMAEAARVDAMFQSMHRPTLFLTQFLDTTFGKASDVEPAISAPAKVLVEVEK